MLTGSSSGEHAVGERQAAHIRVGTDTDRGTAGGVQTRDTLPGLVFHHAGRFVDHQSTEREHRARIHHVGLDRDVVHRERRRQYRPDEVRRFTHRIRLSGSSSGVVRVDGGLKAGDVYPRFAGDLGNGVATHCSTHHSGGLYPLEPHRLVTYLRFRFANEFGICQQPTDSAALLRHRLTESGTVTGLVDDSRTGFTPPNGTEKSTRRDDESPGGHIAELVGGSPRLRHRG